MPKQKEDAVVAIGKKIKQFRTKKKMTLDNVANETGCSIAYLKKIEAGQVMPPVGTLLQISRALQIDSGLLFRERESNLQDRIKAYSKRTENYAYTTLTPGAENKHLKAFRVRIEGLSDHKGVGYQHEGEEFVYVLKGVVEILVGDHVNTLGAGDTLHFNSGIRHKMKNLDENEAELLVVVYGP